MSYALNIETYLLASRFRYTRSILFLMGNDLDWKDHDRVGDLVSEEKVKSIKKACLFLYLLIIKHFKLSQMFIILVKI